MVESIKNIERGGKPRFLFALLGDGREKECCILTGIAAEAKFAM